MEAKHTPTPWRIEFCHEGSDCWCRLIVADVDDAEGDKAIITSGSLRAHNADFIVRACNAHDALVEALKECADDLEVEIQTRAGGELPRRIERDMEVVRKARAALALAGETP